MTRSLIDLIDFVYIRIHSLNFDTKHKQLIAASKNVGPAKKDKMKCNISSGHFLIFWVCVRWSYFVILCWASILKIYVRFLICVQCWINELTGPLCFLFLKIFEETILKSNDSQDSKPVLKAIERLLYAWKFSVSSSI